MRAPGRVPRQRRPSRARRRGGLPFAGRRGPGGARPARRGPRRFRARIAIPDARLGRRPVPRGARARRRARPRIAPVENYLRRADTSAALPPRPRLDRSDLAVRTTSSTVGRLDEGDVARRAGAEEPARPLGLPGDRVRDAPGAHRRDGTYRGGSALYLASLCDLLGVGEVVSIDIEPARRLPGASAHHVPRGPLVDRPRAWSTDVRARAGGRPILVVLDSDHSQAHVEAELAAYAPIVPVGCYVIVEDSNIGQIRKDLMPGPLEAIETFLAAPTSSRSTASGRSS